MKWVTGVLLVTLLALQYDFWFSKGGWQSSLTMQEALTQQLALNAVEQEKNDGLLEEIKDLQEGNEALAEIARDDLGYIEEGEIFYRLINVQPAKK